ncbi:FecR family protein [Hymenobacter sp. DG01]|uniref:FecR family protein n=1 Tax=Hymenobacter sp. DG01 TaxID=2584940 RepID=UPI001123142B|nr:FecR domain-containing protein [Hymenobacter sp. DG01]
MTESEFHLLLQRYLDGQCTPAEQAVVEQWYNRLEEAEGVALPTQNQEAVEDAIWQRLPHPLVAPAPVAPQVRQHPASQPSWVWWAAAMLVFALGLGALFTYVHGPLGSLVGVAQENWTRHRNATRHEQELQLPDGTRVTLHPGSQLRYATSLAGPKREVYLEGEAFFKVSKNPARPFLVFSKQVVTTVLGTSFRVKDYADGVKASVAVSEGKVSVQAREKAELDATPAKPAEAGVILLPNQQVVYSAATRQLRKKLVEKPVVLSAQTLEFDARPVPEVLTALEKAYGVTIVYDEQKLAGCTVSIAFYDEPLLEKIGLLCQSLGASYSLSDAQIIIHSSGCQARPIE